LAFGLSAGRVQTPALRLIVDRQREIDAFVPTSYWLVDVGLKGKAERGFTALLDSVNGEKLEKVIGPGPDNPLGKYAFYLGWPTYMIHGTNKPAGVGLRSSHGCIRLYPEDIAQLFELAPIGTQVRVVNQPYVFGWHDGALHIQAFDVLEDDKRDWKKAQAKLLNKAMAERIQQELKARKEKIDWEAVAKLSEEPRGIPVSVTGGPDQLDAIVLGATLVQNKVAPGATWDGLSDLPVDEATFQELVSDREPSVESAEAAATPASPGTTRPQNAGTR
jgi:L,D-transpeptidase ErfK/SrfK